jgi:hypothetical protein
MDNSKSYSADQIIGKNLIAKKSVELKRLPDTNAKTIYTVKPGQPVGNVYSYIGGDTTALFWMFYDSNGKTYYAEHQPGIFDIGVLKDQGVLTVAEETKKKEEAAGTGAGMFNVNVPNPFQGAGKYVGIGLLVATALIAYNLTSNSSR